MCRIRTCEHSVYWRNIGILLTERQLTVTRSGLMATLNTFRVV